MSRWSTVLLSLAGVAMAQTLDTAILGTVTDPGGAVVAHAAVTVTSTAAGVAHSVVTRADGAYEVRYLVPGEYTVEVRAPGFRSERRTGIVIQIGQQARIDFSLQLGEVQQTVEVVGAAPLLQTENATLGEVVGTERMVNLPLNGRSFTQLAALTPGVRVADPSQYTSTTDGSRIVANGARRHLDAGQPGWRHHGGEPQQLREPLPVRSTPCRSSRCRAAIIRPSTAATPAPTSTCSFAPAPTSFTAAFSNSSATTIWTRARFFRPEPLPKDVLRRNQFGAVVSGPIRRDRTFFMVGYEGVRSAKDTPGTNIVFTPAMRRGDFTAFSTPVTDPLNNNTPFAGNMIPANRLNPVALNLLNYMPQPNTSGTVNFSSVQRGTLNTDQGLVRIDQYFGSHDQVLFHYVRSRRDFPFIDLNPNFRYNGTYPNSSLAVQYIHTFSPNLLNEVRVGWNKSNVSQLSPRTNTDFTIESLGHHGNAGGRTRRPAAAAQRGRLPSAQH